MRVLILANDIEALGGASVAAVNYYNLLGAANFDVDILDYNSISRHYTSRYGLFYKISNWIFAPLFYVFNPYVYFFLRAYVAEKKVDHSILHLYVGGLSNSAKAALYKSNVKVSHVVHDYRQICPANALLDASGKRCEMCRKGIYQVVARNCKNNFFISLMVYFEALIRKNFFSSSKFIFRYIFVSEFAKNKHIEFFGDSIRSSVVYNATPKPTLSKDVRSVYDSELDIVFIGRLSDEKGILELLDAVSGTDIRLDLFGRGPLEQLVKCRAKSSSNIRFNGALERSEVLDVFAKYKFSVVASNWYENNPISVIESLSVGTPVISTGFGGLPEMAVDRRLVLSDPPSSRIWGAQIQDLLEMPVEAYARLSRDAKKVYLRKFSEKRAREDLVQILNVRDA